MALVALSKRGLGKEVVGTEQQTDGIDDGADSYGGIKAESLIGDDAYMRMMEHEILGDERNEGVGTDKDGDILGGGTVIQDLSNLRYQLLKHVLLIAVIAR